MQLTRTLALSLTLAASLTGCQQADTAASRSAAEAADLVLVGGKIVTVDEAQPEPQALAARGDRIVAVGTRAEIEALIGDTTEVIDLQGRLAIPGFIETHGHFMGLGDSRIQLDLRRAASWQEIVDMVAAAVAAAAPGEWIRGRGWHQDKWDSVPEPSLEGIPLHGGLSAVSPENPVLLTHASGHGIFVNAQAMELAGIDGGTANPQGGEILKDAAGAPTGFLRETAQGIVHRARNRDSATSAQESRKMVELATLECLQKGVTSFQDAGSSFATVDFLRQMAQEGVLSLRLWVMIRSSNEDLAADIGRYRAMDDLGGFVQVGGIKVSIDGALGSRGAWLLEPYSDSPGSTGLNLVPMEVVAETAEIAIENSVQLCIHAIGDRGNREVLDLYEKAFAAHPDKTDLRWRIEHAQHLHPDDIPRFAAAGVTAAVQGVHCTSDGPWVPDRLGDQRSEGGAYVWQKLLQSGALVVNGTDVPVEDVSPIASYYASVSRRLPDGSRFYPDQRMSRMEALVSYTRDAAKAVFHENDKGTLTAGKLADIVVLSQDILTVDEDKIPETKVIYTIVGGKVVYRGAS